MNEEKKERYIKDIKDALTKIVLAIFCLTYGYLVGRFMWLWL